MALAPGRGRSAVPVQSTLLGATIALSAVVAALTFGASLQHLASRLKFDCTPVGEFLGLDVNGRRVSFCENVFYEVRDRKIWQVWSVIDKAAIEAQL